MDFTKFTGVITAMATPMTKEEHVDEEGMRRLVNYQIAGGVRGLFVLGSTGEFPSLSDAQRHRTLEIVVDEVKGRVPVLVSVSDTCLETTKEHIAHAAKIGADAIVVSTPYYYGIESQKEMIRHFRSVAEYTPLPMFIYNVPASTKNFVQAESILEMSKWDKVVGIKDSTCNFTHFQKLVDQNVENPEFRILQGSEFDFCASVMMGAHGGVLGIANVAPKICVAAYEAAAAGDIKKAHEYQQKITEISQIYWMSDAVLGGLKAGLKALGICEATVARPEPAPSEELIEKVKSYVLERKSWI